MRSKFCTLAAVLVLFPGALSAAVATMAFDSGAGAKARITRLSWDTEANASDFDGDRRADLLWRDTAGNNVIWFMNGGTLRRSEWIRSLPSVWQAEIP